MTQYKTKEERRKFYKSKSWKELRQEVLREQNHECQWCKQEGKVTIRSDAVLEIDHIKPLEDYPKFALDKDNMRVLCREHHNQRHNRFVPGSNRKYNKWDQDERW